MGTDGQAENPSNNGAPGEFDTLLIDGLLRCLKLSMISLDGI